MKKYFLTATFLLAFAFQIAAQTPLTDSSTNTIFAINAEQLMEKAGFENLMKMAFDKNDDIKKQTPEVIAKQTSIRKALAAIYGAGINFNKKMWYVIKSKPFKVTNNVYNYKDYETPLRLFIIPVANRQVMEQQIVTLINTSSETNDTAAFKKNGNIAYLNHKKDLFILSDDELIVAKLPEKKYDYYNDVYNGKTIKSDTVITPKIATAADDETVEIVEKPKATIEIDRLLPNGKIKRLFIYKKEKNTITFTPPKIVADTVMAKVDDVSSAVEAATVVVDSVAAIMDTTTYNVKNNIHADTLNRREYINDSTYVTIYYLQYTEEEKIEVEKKNEEEKLQKRQNAIALFLKSYTTYLPNNLNSTVIQQLSTATADIYIYGQALIIFLVVLQEDIWVVLL